MSKLSQYFVGIAAKRLSTVETDPDASNQHEFNGTKQLVQLFGTEKTRISCTYLYFDDDEEKTAIADGWLTWYDARERHARRTEYRLYFQENTAVSLAAPGDLLIIGKRPDGRMLVLVAKKGSTAERQVLWLFGIQAEGDSFAVHVVTGEGNREIGYAERTILEALGIETTAEDAAKWIDLLLEKFGGTFPKTNIFSAFARLTLPHLSVLDSPDDTLLAWINQEEMLFRILERHIVQQHLDRGFADVDHFVEFSLSVQNRRKSRVGYALENHLAALLEAYGITFSRGQVTENRSRPDFVFPGIAHYHDPTFPVERLTMLGAKSTCKDRWRQVLAEAERIAQKHLLTLEPGISQNQTDEMRAKRLQLVLPKPLHDTYLPTQRPWLMDVAVFVSYVKARQ